MGKEAIDKSNETDAVRIDASAKPRKLWNTNYIRVMSANFLLYFAFFLLTPLLPIYLSDQFDADKDTIGIVLSGYVIAALLMRPFSGFIVDTFDRKRVLVICFFFFFVCFAGYIAAGTLLMFAIVRTLHGLPFGATTVANSTVAIDVLPSERRNEGVGYYGLSNNLAMAIAPSAGVYLYHVSGDFVLLFWIALFAAFLGMLCAMSVRLQQRPPVPGKRRLSLDHFFLTRAWMMAVNIGLFALCWGILSSYVAIYAKERLGITGGTGVFFALLATGLFVSRLWGAKSLRAGHITANCVFGVLVSSVGYTLFALSPGQWAYYVSALLIGLGNGRMYPAFLNMFIKVARHDQRGTANSSILTSWDMGVGVGMLAGGVLAEYAGYAAAFWAAAVVQVAGAAMFILRTRRFFLQRRLYQDCE